MKNVLKILVVNFLIMILFTSCQEKDKMLHDSNINQTSTKVSEDHFNSIIGHIDNGKYVFSGDILKKIHKWEKVIKKNSSLNLSFDSVFIEKLDGKYFLTGIDKSADATSRIKLVLVSGKFYEAKFMVSSGKSSSPGGYSCTCSGCKSTGPDSAGECTPKQDENGWYCTDCSDGNCEKTVTFENGGIL